MMLGGNNTTAANDVVLGNSGEEAAATTTSTSTTSGAREGSREAGLVDPINNCVDEDKEGDRTFGGNRWPRQETLALLNIRSDMDATFRDASLKGPLWEKVSRKLAELGYNRSSKKCKEKFENVYKYHKRTKEGRTGKSDGKTYRFFDQLEALDSHHPCPIQLQAVPQSQKPSINSVMATTTTMAITTNPPIISTVSQVTVPSTTAIPTMSPNNIATTPATINLTIPSFPPITNPTVNLPPPAPTNPPPSNPPSSFPNMSADLLSNSTSSSTSSDVELGGKRKRKRKWKDFFESLMKEVTQKQEKLQKRFLEAIEKRERERMLREEAWRMQEMARMNQERELLAQERSIAAAKDAAVMALLQKLSEQQNQPQPQNSPSPPIPQQSQRPPAQPPQQPAPPPAPAPVPVPAPAQALPPPQPVKKLDTSKTNNGDQNFSSPPSSSRWPKVEVSALIRLRTNLDAKYQDNGPKGPLWEEISAGMRKLGYNRNSKRCKEKWENINKYFKKVKESNKKRPEDSKTCPYYHELDALYRERSKLDHSSLSNQIKPENSVPLMVQPEQQWPPSTTDHQPDHRPDLIMEDIDHMDQNQEDDDNDYDDDEEGEEEGGGYEIVANKGVHSMGTSE